MPTEHTKCFKN